MARCRHFVGMLNATKNKRYEMLLSAAGWGYIFAPGMTDRTLNLYNSQLVNTIDNLGSVTDKEIVSTLHAP